MCSMAIGSIPLNLQSGAWRDADHLPSALILVSQKLGPLRLSSPVPTPYSTLLQRLVGPPELFSAPVADSIVGKSKW